MDLFFAAEEAVCEAVPAAVRRHRSAGVLTWRLIHQIEEEVLAEVASTGKHNKRILGMLRAPAVLNYPTDDQPVSFVTSTIIPIVFCEIEKVWQRVN